MLAEYRLTLPAVARENADDAAKAVLDTALAQVGFIPNMYARMVNSPGLLDTYLHGYAAFRNGSGFSPVEQEVVFLVISRENGCEYCVSAHSMLAQVKAGVAGDIVESIRQNGAVEKSKVGALIEFTRVMVGSRGLPRPADVEPFLAAGYEQRHILEIVLAISVKILSNYANHLFHTPVDEVFADHRWTESGTD